MSGSPESYAASHQEALELEVSVLTALLRRNKASHRRCKYFQRLQMALRALHRHAVLDFFPRLQQQHASNCKKRKRDERSWNVADETTRSTGTECKKNLQSIAIITSLSECVDRLEYAATCMFVELSRGFFMPFMTVGLGTASRIRTLLLRLGRYALTVVPAEESSLAVVVLFQQEQQQPPLEFFTRTKLDRRQSMLQSLGLPVPADCDDTETNSCEVPRQGQSASLADTGDDSLSGGILDGTTETDIGESILRRDDEVMDGLVMIDRKQSNKNHDPRLDSVDNLDRNSEIVESFKVKKRKEKPTSSSLKRKKKSKKIKKGDFFDELFGK